MFNGIYSKYNYEYIVHILRSVGSWFQLEMAERHKFDDVFEMVLSELEPVCLEEQEFCIAFFNLNSNNPLPSIEVSQIFIFPYALFILLNVLLILVIKCHLIITTTTNLHQKNAK